MYPLFLMLLGYCIGKVVERWMGMRARELENKILADEYRRQQKRAKAEEKAADANV